MARSLRCGRLVIATLAVTSFFARPESHAATGVASVEVLRENQNLVQGIDGGLGVIISSVDGAFVYVAGSRSDGVAVLSRDPGSGKLTFVQEATFPTVQNPQALALSPFANEHLYVASRIGTVTAFYRDLGTGMLSFLEAEQDGVFGVEGLRGAGGVVVSPDGEHVYVTAELDDSIVVFDRIPLTGGLVYVAGVTGAAVDRPSGIAMSPDALHVYVANTGNDSVAVYSRDPGTGLLTLVEEEEDGVAGVVGLDGAVGVTVSPNGAHVYVVGEGDDGVAVFSRNPVTGALTFVERELGDALFSRRLTSVVVSKDGTHVFAAGRSRDAVVLFDRDTSTGALTFVDGEKLEGAMSLAVSPDGLHAYSGSLLPLLGVFRLTDVACTPVPAVGCTVPFEGLESSVLLKDKPPPDDADTFTWKWGRGSATSLAAFGDPVNTTNDMVVCIYDASPNPQPIFRARLLAGGGCDGKPCWKTQSTTGYKYKDADRGPDGLVSAGLRSGPNEAARIKLKGKGPLLDMPLLPLAPPVTVQLQASLAGSCWETVHTTPSTNDGVQFKSKDN